MARKSTIGTNPLDAVVPMRRDETKRVKPQAEPARATKKQVSFQLPVGLIEKARDVVFFSPGFTMASLMEEALLAQLERTEKKHGKPFPSRAGAALKSSISRGHSMMPGSMPWCGVSSSSASVPLPTASSAL